MSHSNLEVYLNDHLAGSVVAMELLDRLADLNSGTPLESFFKNIAAEIEVDRDELRSIMDELNIPIQTARQTSGWLSEKFANLKMSIDESGGNELRMFESLEILSLGIEGKRTLWLALAEVAPTSEVLQARDFDRLIRTAAEQRKRIDEKRLEAARKAIALTAE